MKQKLIFISAAIALLLIFVFGIVYYNQQKTNEAVQAAEQNQALLIRDYSPTFGAQDAKVHIVEFFDPACETCRDFYPLVKGLMAEDRERIRLSLRYAPFHEGSGEVVKMLEAARLQAKFWPALEALFSAQSNWVMNHKSQPQLAWHALEGLGLNLEQMRRDMESPEIARRIEQDLADAKALNVTMTPEYFVNGRPLPSFGFDELKALVRDALAQAYR